MLEKVIAVTIMPLKRAPTTIPIIDLDKDIDNKYEAREPVQTPVIGKGMPINRIRPNILYFSILWSFLFVRFKIGLMINERIFNLSKMSIRGETKYLTKIPIEIFELTAIKNILNQFKSLYKIKYGIVPLNSIIGSIE